MIQNIHIQTVLRLSFKKLTTYKNLYKLLVTAKTHQSNFREVFTLI